MRARPSINRPMYGISPVFELIQTPGNAGTLTTGGTPRTGSTNGSGIGEYWQVKLHQNGKYRIDVKGSESSQYGGSLANPRIKVLAGSAHAPAFERWGRRRVPDRTRNGGHRWRRRT